MKKSVKIILAAAAALLLCFAAVFILRAIEMKNAPDPHITAEEYLNTLSGEGLSQLKTHNLEGEYDKSYRRATLRGSGEYLDINKLSAGLGEEMSGQLALSLDGAARAGEIYNADKSFRQDVLTRTFEALLSARLAEAEKYLSPCELSVELSYDGQRWTVASLSAPFELRSQEEIREELYTAATAQLTYIKKQYRIAEGATSAPAPDQSLFGSTDDPAVIETLLASPQAQELLNGQEPSWSTERPFVPGRLMRYYLDETILVLQWQEVTAGAVGTFSEIAVADGSQLRRKLAGDGFCAAFEYPTQLAIQANAVLAVGGDLYNHGRACGIVVYDREIYRFEPKTCDTCYITASGELLYSRAGQFTDQAQAQSFVDENDVLFSLCFGPILIENGQDVTPDSYAWGEINDTYARSALGLLGKLHYLTLNINLERPDYNNLATLRQATDAMLAHGCQTAYALDGGQTACTVLNGELINVVQFNTEKITSDIIYFATALPAE